MRFIRSHGTRNVLRDDVQSNTSGTTCWQGLARGVLAAVLLVLLSACSEQSLYSDLSEQEANEIVAELSNAGIEASKNRMKGDVFSVTTSPDDFAVAVALLKNSGLPRKHYDTLGEVFAKEGFVSSPLEERARLNYALSQEIASTISSIDGVILARVHLAIPQVDELSDKQAPSSASVFVKHRADVDLTGSVSKIKALVVNGIENLAYDDVTVALFESSESDSSQSSEPTSAMALLPTTSPVVATGGASTSNTASTRMSMLPGLPVTTAAGLLAGFGLLLTVVFAGIRYWRRRQS